MSLLKGKQICVAADLARRAEAAKIFIQGLADDARDAGLLDAAHGFDVIATGTSRVGLQLDMAARATFVAARQGEELPQ